MPTKENLTKEIKLEELYIEEYFRNKKAESFGRLISQFNEKFDSKNHILFSSPGRIEIGGNHTDHNNGCILAAAINIDSSAVVSKNSQNRINLFSRDLKETYSVELDDLEVKQEEKSKTSGLIRGLAYKFRTNGYNVGGFDCILESMIGIGSGLSSSASIEMLIATILNSLYNNSEISPVELAKYGQFAENNYFGKPCGLMDQLAIAEGGIVSVDFKNEENPKVEKLNVDFATRGFSIIVVNTGGTHADLTDDYASIPKEMKDIAGYFGKSRLRLISRDDIIKNIFTLREIFGDRAVLRALHFFEENERVGLEVASLKENKTEEFLKLVKQSGNSSAKWLQNIYSTKDNKQQSMSLALEITEYFMKENSSCGATRVHGGGFAGTILTFIEEALADKYIKLMSAIFSESSALKVSVREYGSCRVKL
ncbi:MAG: galactokinase family protein [Bacteroidota bacterium]|nr:galactokinase family protein [Bacteroidota bacterium]MDP4192048.1 galactokinase family protein [Bacteroidota bacterium]MDP4194469.1 galactokinase family protein [Bacteroidota bacterium]